MRQNLDYYLVWYCDIGTGPVVAPQLDVIDSVNALEEASLKVVGML